MLDSLLKAQTVTPAAISGLTDLLINFYRSAPPDSLTADAYVRRFRDQIEVDRETISIPRFRIDHARAGAIAERLNERLHALDGILRNRVAAGCIVEGHGDLRPEHVSLGDPIRVIDRLEFNRDLRLVDPFDELAFLGMECAVAGAEWIAPLMIRAASAALAPAPPTELIEFYTATRASLRARLSLAHLLDPVPREPQKWEPKAERYLDQAARALSLPRPAVR
jgi:aminoglycoside phosphotransferase family enzyme